MRRPERRKTILETVARIRAAVPDVAIRTTCIVGFPGETDEDFDILLNVLEETMFDRVGVFTYSAQEGTRAADLTDDVPDAIKRERLERVNEMQRLITAARNEGRVGRTIGALVDRVTEQGVEARVVWQADDVDGITVIEDGTGPAGREPSSMSGFKRSSTTSTSRRRWCASSLAPRAQLPRGDRCR